MKIPIFKKKKNFFFEDLDFFLNWEKSQERGQIFAPENTKKKKIKKNPGMLCVATQQGPIVA